MSLEPCPVCDGTPRVLVAVRHPVMRRYAAELLARECGCWASSDVAAGEMLPAAIDRFRPDLLVVDAGDFPACCQAAIDAFPRDRVVVIGPEPDPSYGAAALANGAAACVTRDNVGEELVPTMRAILGCRHEHCPSPSAVRDPACEVVVVSAPACHLCADAERALAELAKELPLDIRVVEASSDEGRRAVSAHGTGMFPVVLVDGALFSVGRLPRGKLRKLLAAKAA